VGGVIRIPRCVAVIVIVCLAASAGWGYASAAALKVLTVVQNADATTLDPWNTGANVALGLERAFYEGLFGFDSTMKVRPVLAKSWSVSADGLTYTIKLQSGVRFHDGTPFNAQAVKINLDRVLDQANHLQKYGLFHTVSHIQAVTAVDSSTVQLTLSAPSATLINNLAHPSAGMISPAALTEYGAKGIATHPVGTGQFVFDGWVHGDRIVAKRNPNYWRAGMPGTDEIVFRNVPDATQALAMLKTGEAQFVYPLDPINITAVSGQPGVKVVNAPSIFVTYLTMNEKYVPFSKPGVRLAMNYAVDKPALISTLYLGYAKVMRSMVGSQLAGYVPVGTYSFDTAKARQLLSENGYPQGFPATLWVPNDTFSQKEAVFLQQQFAQIGVTVTITPMEAGTFDSSVYQGPDKNKGQLILFGFSPSNGATDWALRAELSTVAWPPALFNVDFYSNPQVDRLLGDAEHTTALSQRNGDYKQVQEIVFKDAPWVWLAEPINVWGMSTSVGNAYVLPDQTVQVQDAVIH
jgi:glutathione transport system substrate-binding protein